MTSKKKELATNEEVAQHTGRSVEEWFGLLRDQGLTPDRLSPVVQFLTDEHGLQLYWAHCIGHKYCDGSG